MGRFLMAVTVITLVALGTAIAMPALASASAVVQASNSSSDIDEWVKNYEILIDILKANPAAGDCSLSLSVDPSAPANSYRLELKKAGKTIGFELDSPRQTLGRSRASFETETEIYYAMSDVVGWVNLIVRLENDRRTIREIELNKTLPNGTIYDHGPRCTK